MSNISKDSLEILATMPLTEDDKKRFSPRGSLAIQLADSIGKALFVSGYNTKKFAGTELTRLEIAEESTSVLKANLTIAYDLQNVYLTSGKGEEHPQSLQELGIGNEGRDALAHLANFTVDEIVETGTFPFKYSKACQSLGIGFGEDIADYKALSKLYNSSPDMQVARDDADKDISWLEIRKIYITPITE
jgi:hypothetical protein